MLGLALAALLVAADGISWTNDMKAAGARAAAERRPLLLQFRDPICEATSDTGGTAMGPADGRPAHGSIIRGDILSPCSKMQEDVWDHRDTARAVERYVPVIMLEGSDRKWHRQYEVATLPTTLLTDPWGNEIVRMVRYVERPAFLRIVGAMPYDFAAAEPAARKLAADPHDAAARAELARFYESAGLREIAEKYYEKALLAPAASDPALRREIAVGRGLNLLKLGRAKDAVSLFEKELDAGRDADKADVVMLGLVLAHAQAGRRKEAEQVVKEMRERFPASPYTQRAAQVLASR